MSRVRADKLVNRAATGAPSLTYGIEVPVGYGITGAGGINVSGVATVGGVGSVVVSGITTVSDTTESTSATTGALVISGGVGIAKSLNVTGNVTVGGTLTYEDVTNVDVLGIATYRESLYVGSTEGSGAGAGISMHNTGNAIFAGIGTINTLHTGVAVTGPARGFYAEGILVHNASAVTSGQNIAFHYTAAAEI